MSMDPIDEALEAARRRAERRARLGQILAWAAVAVVVLAAVGAGLRAAGGEDEPRAPVPSVPAVSVSPSPAYLERPTPAIRERVRDVLDHVVAKIRRGEWSEADEIVRAQDAARSAGCQWALVQQVYLEDDDLSRIGAEAVMRDVEARYELAHGTYRVRRDVPTTPEIRHAYRDGRVVHEVLRRRVAVFLAVRCSA